ncbi:flagellar hook capping protein [Burkholderia pseudomallei]|nr:flagellar hook capping protein [Burkholderia pseudomallei]QBL82903.1 flagellar hook capping protein [Burkholderia pseudomallei]QBP53383.1 flagellar hook capping protein [Burkholderia pseudomallei]QBP60039.1 flagellar hook capping protein [Burkholderia pseudomallei]QBP73309.1 flagellar hook capping protein [Burkholderia pseudomallei]
MSFARGIGGARPAPRRQLRDGGRLADAAAGRPASRPRLAGRARP